MVIYCFTITVKKKKCIFNNYHFKTNFQKNQTLSKYNTNNIFEYYFQPKISFNKNKILLD